MLLLSLEERLDENICYLYLMGLLSEFFRVQMPLSTIANLKTDLMGSSLCL